jgi:hypothetical protein
MSDNDPAVTVEAQITHALEKLAALDPALTADLVEHLRRAGTAGERLFGDPAPIQAAPALPDPPPAPFEYTDEEIYDRQERAARFRGQRRTIEHEGSPWAG